MGLVTVGNPPHYVLPQYHVVPLQKKTTRREKHVWTNAMHPAVYISDDLFWFRTERDRRADSCLWKYRLYWKFHPLQDPPERRGRWWSGLWFLDIIKTVVLSVQLVWNVCFRELCLVVVLVTVCVLFAKPQHRTSLVCNPIIRIFCFRLSTLSLYIYVYWWCRILFYLHRFSPYYIPAGHLLVCFFLYFVPSTRTKTIRSSLFAIPISMLIIVSATVCIAGSEGDTLKSTKISISYAIKIIAVIFI